MMSSIRRKIIQAGDQPGTVIQLTNKEWASLFKAEFLPNAFGSEIKFKLVRDDDGRQVVEGKGFTGQYKKISFKLAEYNQTILESYFKKIHDLIIDNLHLLTERSEVVITLDMVGLLNEEAKSK